MISLLIKFPNIQIIGKIKEEFADAYYWISIDETTDKAGRAIANLLLGKLDGERWHSPQLISMKVIEGSIDSGAMARFVNEGIG